MDSAQCGNCGHDLIAAGLDLLAKPKLPCPACGSHLRKYAVSVREGVKVSDHVRALGFRDEALRFITESARGGLASSAEVSEAGLRQRLKGRPIQGEDDTVATCRRLVAAMNSSGADWEEPAEGDGDDDCVSASRAGGDFLRIQVVRAVADRDFWRSLARKEELTEAFLSEMAANRLREAIDHKTGLTGIPPKGRPALVLALDAGRVPALAFEEVATRFRELHGGWAESLGFKQVWVVGPDRRLIHQLA